MKTISVSVTELARFVHRRGDIDARREETTDMSEGVQAQRKYQEILLKKFHGYQTEVLCNHRYTSETLELKIQGRADGIMLEPEILVEEIKTTRKIIEEFCRANSSAHRAQVNLYAAILLKGRNFDDCITRVTYVNPDTLSYQSFDEKLSLDELEKFLAETCAVYDKFIRTLLARFANRDAHAKNQEIPFTSISDEQLNLARRVYMSIRDGENLMFESPTGTGKTVATLFPTVKALGEQLIERTVFATARTTGQSIAEETMGQLSESNPHLRTITITAKDRICFTPGALCVPEQCEFAKGHYDRIPKAREDLLKRTVADKRGVEMVSRVHRVCPYELSLEGADWSDVVICDYNYVFDPFVSLKRLQSREFRKLSLLIDEAHRLGERTSEMLSASLSVKLFTEIHEKFATQTIGRIARSIATGIVAFKSQYLEDSTEAMIDVPREKFWELLQAFLEAVDETPIESTHDVVNQCWSAALRFHEGRDRCESAAYIYLITERDEDAVLQMRCITPGSWIKRVLADFQSTVRFSGTLSPFEVFQEGHGVTGATTRITMLANVDRLRVYVLPQISTFFKDRAKSAHKIDSVLQTVVNSSDGNWLVAFPSFEYLNLIQVSDELEPAVVKQTAEMSVEDRKEFIERLNMPNSTLGFVVMGGVFTESVDYAQDALSGVIVVGPALPPPSIELEKIKQSSELGYELAYRQPGMTRVVQAAGRVVRGVHDRGVVILIDPRFSRTEYQSYFPQHWSPKVVDLANLQRELTAFWVGT